MKMYVDQLVSNSQGEVSMFLDENFEVIGVVYNNDANWRHEYFNPIFAKIEVDISTSQLLDEVLEEKLNKYLGY